MVRLSSVIITSEEVSERKMGNLLKETLEVLKRHGKKPEDVKWCGSPEYGWFSWDEFVRVADVEYYPSYCGDRVAYDLVIVGEDWWLERHEWHEFDNSDWWEFRTLPVKPEAHRVPRQLVSCAGESLTEIEERFVRKEVRRKVLDYMRKYKKSDITELHKNIGCNIGLLVEIIDELRREGKIGEVRRRNEGND